MDDDTRGFRIADARRLQFLAFPEEFPLRLYHGDRNAGSTFISVDLPAPFSPQKADLARARTFR